MTVRHEGGLDYRVGTHAHTGVDGSVQLDYNDLLNLPALGTAAALNVGVGAGDVAAGDRGVTNGDTHDHNGGDGGQVNHVNLASIGVKTHATIDSRLNRLDTPADGTQAHNIDISAGAMHNIDVDATWAPFADANWAGLLLVTESAITGLSALFIEGGGVLSMIYGDAGHWSMVAGTAGMINVYLAANVLTIQNKKAVQATVNIISFRTRSVA